MFWNLSTLNIFIGFAQASPPYLAESPNNDYSLLPEDFSKYLSIPHHINEMFPHSFMVLNSFLKYYLLQELVAEVLNY